MCAGACVQVCVVFGCHQQQHECIALCLSRPDQPARVKVAEYPSAGGARQCTQWVCLLRQYAVKRFAHVEAVFVRGPRHEVPDELFSLAAVQAVKPCQDSELQSIHRNHTETERWLGIRAAVVIDGSAPFGQGCALVVALLKQPAGIYGIQSAGGDPRGSLQVAPWT